MKRLFFLCLSASFSVAQSLLDEHLKIFSYEERIQRKLTQQMRFNSFYDWRAWGILNSGVRNNLVGGKENFLSIMPQTAFSRSYPLTSGTLFLGMDLSASGGTLDNENRKTLFLDYGTGGYLVWKNDLDFFASFSLKMIQVFQRENQWLNNLMWIGDIGGGKKFILNEGYFFDVAVFFGLGLISATNLRRGQSRLSSPMNVPFNVLSIFSMGRNINQDEVKISISPIFTAYARGKVYQEEEDSLRIIEKSKAHFDFLFSIDYDVKMFDETNFFLYADFNAAQLEVVLGAGFRVGFGKNKYDPLKYPKIEDKNLKKTYLK